MTDILTIFGMIFVAIFFYSLGAAVGFGYKCNRDGQKLSTGARELFHAHFHTKQSNYLIRRSHYEN